MSLLSSFFTYCVIAVFVCNTVFGTGGGAQEAYLLDEKPKYILASGVLVSGYSVLSTLLTAGAAALIPDVGLYIIVYGAVLCLSAAIVYLISARIALKLENVGAKIGRLLAPSAFNGAVIALPLAARNGGVVSLAGALGVAAGAGIGFAAAAFLLRHARSVTDSPRIPAPFRGTPAMLIYIGLISLSLSVLDGTLRIL